ncbi:MAG: hypothetical protein H7A23_00245 [Leptospiraceae bacterium]|nr:hypothetical protein [Leptospiraceae bacterium]
MLSLDEARKKIIQTDRPLLIAGEEAILDRLPAGNWIAGTIPYFMAEEGGLESQDKIFITEIPEFISSDDIEIKMYNAETIPNVSIDAPENGFSLIIIPASGAVHESFAKNAPNYQDILSKPIIGWISGLHLQNLGKETPKVYNGLRKKKTDQDAVVMHITLPKNKAAIVDIINLFNQGEGDVITFEEEGFVVNDCLINGKKTNFSDYLIKNKIDTKLPLVADLYGAMINTSFQSIDEDKKIVNLYAPVFKNIKYKIAGQVGDYVKEFTSKIPSSANNITFSCNCILNYLYSELEGKKTGSVTGPITFGEIAYQLLNQTMVYLTIKDV